MSEVLLASIVETGQVLTQQIEAGEVLAKRGEHHTATKEQYLPWSRERKQWVDVANEALGNVYVPRKVDEFQTASKVRQVPIPWNYQLARERDALDRGLEVLRGFKGQLPHARLATPGGGGSDHNAVRVAIERLEKAFTGLNNPWLIAVVVGVVGLLLGHFLWPSN
jgi:hypothetical protein